MRDCTCHGYCRGADGLGKNWRCVMDRQPTVSERAFFCEHNSAKFADTVCPDCGAELENSEPIDDDELADALFEAAREYDRATRATDPELNAMLREEEANG